MEGPTNPLVNPLLTDMYQISMAYAYWKNGKADDHAVFDLFFRKNPFKGEYCVFAGLDECLRLCQTFKFTASDVDYLKTILPGCDQAFFTWMLQLDCSQIKMYSFEEGSIVYPKEPLIRVEGPLAIAQLLETTLLNLINFPSLIATNACRMRKAAGQDKVLMEFGLRRAQGPDGAMSASRYSYMGGFDATSNVQAGKLFGVTVKGTHAHSFVMSYTSLEDLHSTTIVSPDGSKELEFVALVLKYRNQLHYTTTNDGELAAFIAYVQAFPNGAMCLIDTYDTLSSGTLNFILVGLALIEIGYKPVGVRLDSGDLAYLSREVRKKFLEVDSKYGKEIFKKCTIVASNDINEEVLISLANEGHEIDSFGIGTNLVTCQKQPALGCVYKLVEIQGKPRIKLSQDVEKLLIPGRKNIYRLYGTDGHSLIDIMQTSDESPPEVGVKILARNAFMASKRAFVTPTEVESLLSLVFDGAQSPQIIKTSTLAEARARCMDQLSRKRADHTRPMNPTPYKVSVSPFLYDYMQKIWQEEAPVAELV